MLVSQGGRKYHQNAFARYLSGMLYESEGEWNSAYIDYKKTFELAPQFSVVQKDLVRLARWLRMDDQAQDWAKRFDISRDEWKFLGSRESKNRSEIVVIYENGISPEKLPNPYYHSIPMFVRRHNPVEDAEVYLDGEAQGKTQVLFDVEQIAIQNLEEKFAGIIAKKVAGAVAKEAVSYGLGQATQSREVQGIARLIFYLADQADLRSWKLLPKDFQVLRVPATPGVHTIQIQAGREKREKTVQVEPGKKVFVSFRYLP
jgi:hypothetical protein